MSLLRDRGAAYKNDIFSIIVSNVSWKWIFWVMMVFAGACTVISVLFLPETFGPVLLLRKVSGNWKPYFCITELATAGQTAT